MKCTVKRWCALASVFLLAAAVFPVNAFASSKKTVTGLTFRIQSKLEAGDKVGDSSVVVGTDPGDGQVSISLSGERCYISEADFSTSSSKVLKIGDEIQLKVVVLLNDEDEYKFKGSYSSSNIKVNGGEYISCSKSSSKLTVKLKTRPVKGTYDTPENAEWRDSGIGHARWTAPDYSSGHYDVILKRGGTEVVRKTDIGSTSYDFYPYMTKAGTYTFRVRTVPHSTDAKTYGKASEWVDSDEYYLDEKHVSDGTGQDADGTGNGSGTGAAGWIKESGSWYYKYPNGTLQKDSWVKVNDIWYLFDTNGKMLTGWQTKPGGTFYLNESGAMLEGLCQLGGKWYYLNPDPNTGTEGALVKNALYTVDGETYFAGAKGERMTGWVKVSDHWSYFDPQSGAMQRNTTVDTFHINADGVWVPN